MSTRPQTYLSPEEYLELERRAEYKSEYSDGTMVAMAGGSERHALLISNLFIELGQQLKPRKCRIYSSDLRLRVSATGLYTYPDVMVVCGPPEFADDRRDTVVNPVVIIEVLSDSTKNYDRGEKFRHYRGLKTLTEYVLVDQDSIHIEHFVRQSDGRWVMTEIDSPDAFLQLSSIECTVPLADVYDKVEFGG